MKDMVKRITEEVQGFLASRSLVDHEVPLGSGQILASREWKLAQYLDHTLLKPQATFEDYERLYREAQTLGCASVCVPPSRVREAYEALNPTPVMVCTVIGFPWGYDSTLSKAKAVELAGEDGADELDMVINRGHLLEPNWLAVYKDIAAVVDAAEGKVVKVIVEATDISSEQLAVASYLAKAAGASFVKTSTGFGGGGARIQDIEVMREAVGPNFGIKASGGVRSEAFAWQCIEAGADRIGTSSAAALVMGGEVSGGY